jgi:hypothetical protein
MTLTHRQQNVLNNTMEHLKSHQLNIWAAEAAATEFEAAPRPRKTAEKIEWKAKHQELLAEIKKAEAAFLAA